MVDNSHSDDKTILFWQTTKQVYSLFWFADHYAPNHKITHFFQVLSCFETQASPQEVYSGKTDTICFPIKSQAHFFLLLARGLYPLFPKTCSPSILKSVMALQDNSSFWITLFCTQRLLAKSNSNCAGCKHYVPGSFIAFPEQFMDNPLVIDSYLINSNQQILIQV